GYTANSYRGTVHFTSSDGKVILPPDSTFAATDAGMHSFSATLKTAGSQSITATDTVTPSITGSQTVTVTPGVAANLSLAAPASATAGTSFSVTVTLTDASGNVATGYRGTIHFTSSDARALLPADYT